MECCRPADRQRLWIALTVCKLRRGTTPMDNQSTRLRTTILASLGTMAMLTACTEQKAGHVAPIADASAERLVVSLQPTEDLRPVAAVYTTRDQAEARARIGGTLVALSVREGDTVRRGQVLGRVQDDRLGLQTNAMDAQVVAASAEATRASADLTRTRDLYEHGVYAKARLEQVEAAARAADAQLRAARAQHAASADLVGQGAIVAPAAGTVLHAPTPAGSVVSPGQSVVMITAGPKVIRLQLPEAQAGALRSGQILQIRGDDGVVKSSGPVVQVYPAVSGGEVTVDLAADTDAQALIGRRIDVLAPVGQRMAIVIPRRFVTSRYGVDYVRLRRPDGASEDVIVQTAPATSADRVEILSGLRAGDTVLGVGVPR
jgi:RND family efflux transporter MFP subunit